MVYASGTRGPLPTRVTQSGYSHKCEEKLDKWLYLEPYVELKKICMPHQEWNDQLRRLCNRVVSVDCIYQLQEHGISPEQLGYARLTPRIVSLIHDVTLNHSVPTNHIKQSDIRKIRTVIHRAIDINLSTQHAHLTSNSSVTLNMHSDELFHQLLTKSKNWPREVQAAWFISEDFMRVAEIRRKILQRSRERTAGRRTKSRWDQMRAKGIDTPYVVNLKSLGATMLITCDVCVLQWKGVDYLVPEDLLLELHNKTAEMFCALLFSHMQSGVSVPNSHYADVVQFYRIICHEMIKTPYTGSHDRGLRDENKPFKFLKAMEGLGVAFMIATEDLLENWENETLLTTMWNELYHNRVVSCEKIYDHPLGELFQQMNTPQIAEVIGTVKLFGHPSILVDVGVNDVYNRTHNDIAVNADAVRRGRGILIRDIIKGFRIKYKKLPDIEIDDLGLAHSVKRLYDRHIALDTRSGARVWNTITPDEWATVKFRKNREFDPIDNQLSVIKDKALGLTRSQVFYLLVQQSGGNVLDGHRYPLSDCEDESYDIKAEKKIFRDKEMNEDYYQNLHDKMKEDQEDKERIRATQAQKSGKQSLYETKRMLLAYLLDPYFDDKFKNYLNDFALDDPWRHTVINYLVIKLTAKELEIKDLGRFFGASPPVERNRRIAQEMNVMNLMDDLIPDQLMTPDELGIMKRLMSFRYFSQLYPNSVLLQISFDFSKWNNNMRAACIDETARRVLDPLFGFPIFGKTMKAFQNMFVFLSEKGYERWWNGQEGGIEGLNQATWSLIFLSGLKGALEDAGLDYSITVKGDDVRAVIAIPAHRVNDAGGLDIVKNDMMDRIQRLCTQMGWQLNPHESFVSLTLIATSKQYQIRKTWLTAATKKIMKMTSLSNLLFPTLEDLVGSVFSSAHSACSQTTVIYPAYTSALIVASLELVRGIGLKNLDSEKLAMYLMWPQVLGGPGALPLQTFFVRGENDMLSVTLSLFRSIILSEDHPLKDYVFKILNQGVTEKPDGVLLLSDCYAIPLDIPERPSSLLKRMIRNSLKKWVKNPHIAYLLSDKGTNERKQFVEALLTLRPMVIKLIAVIYENSPYSLEDEVLAKFMESPTVVTLFSQGRMKRVSTNKAHRMLSKITVSARLRIDHWVNTLNKLYIPMAHYLNVPVDVWTNRRICSTDVTYRVRAASWGLPIEGITYPSLVDQLVIARGGELQFLHPAWRVNELCIKAHRNPAETHYQTNYASDHYASWTGIAPWVGSQTAPKAYFPKLNSSIKSPSLSKVLRLLTLRRITHTMGPQLRSVINQCLKSLTLLPLEDVIVLSPQGDSGHVAHRLAVNSFSMNTMPNYRVNILQILHINTDSLLITKYDSRDRTINYAAIHFYLAAMFLLPLQLSERLPPDYPIVFEAMFHAEDNQDVHYEPCRNCCKVEIDPNQVTISTELPSNMINYATVTLVGCSAYENAILMKNRDELLARRMREGLTRLERDDLDGYVQEEASAILMHKMLKSAHNRFGAAIAANFRRVPDGQVLEAVAASLGLVDVFKISLATLRLIRPRDLYLGVLSSVIKYVTEYLIDGDYNMSLNVLKLITPYRNPFKNVFAQFIQAGVMNNLKLGSMEINIPGVELDIAPKCTTDGHTASQVFITAHIPALNRWVRGVEVFPRGLFLISMEDNEEIVTQSQIMYDNLLRLVTRNLIVHNGHRGLVRNLFRKLCKLIRQDEELNPGEMYSDNVVILAALERHGGDLGVNLANQLMTALVDVDNNREVVPLMVHLYWVTRLHLIIPGGDWTDLRDEMIVPGMRLLLVNPRQDIWEIEDIDEDTLMQTPFFITASSVIPPDVLVEIMNVTNGMNQYGALMPPDVTEYSYMLYDIVARWVDPLNFIQVYALTPEECERMIKRAGHQDITDEDVRLRFVRDVARRVNNPNSGGFPDNWNRATRGCTLSDLPSHNNMRLKRYVGTERRINNRDYILGLFQYLVTREGYQVVVSSTFDPVEVTRGLGRHNTSIAKYAEILDKLGFNRYPALNRDTPVVGVCLCDGLGGVTAYLANLSPNWRVVYNSLTVNLVTGATLADASDGHPPIETLDNWFPRDLHSRVVWAGQSPGDIRLVEVQDMLIANIQGEGIPPVIITMDADIDWNATSEMYRDVLWGAWRVAANVANEWTIHIFKTFCIRDFWILKFILSLFHLYRHAHIVRCVSTRQHSSEIMIIVQDPINPDNLLRDIEALLEDDIGIPLVLNTQATVIYELTQISQSMQNFRLHRVSNYTTEPARTLERSIRMSTYPLRLNQLLRWFKLDGYELDGHLCQFTTRLDDVLTEVVAIHKAMVQPAGPGGNLFAAHMIRGGDRIAGSWQFLRIEFIQMVKIYTLQSYLRHNPLMLHNNTQEALTTLITDVVMSLLNHFREPLLQRQGTIEIRGNYILRCDRRYEDNITLIIRQALHKIEQIRGCLILLRVASRYFVDARAFNSYRRAFSVILQWGLCCEEYVQTVYNNWVINRDWDGLSLDPDIPWHVFEEVLVADQNRVIPVEVLHNLDIEQQVGHVEGDQDALHQLLQEEVEIFHD